LNGTILFKQLRVEGFVATRWLPKWPEAFKQINEWIEQVRTYVYRTTYVCDWI